MKRALLGPDALDRAVDHIAAQIAERVAPPRGKLGGLVGIRRGGPEIAERIANALAGRGVRTAIGSVDIALYRDDAASAPPDPKIGPSRIDFSVEGVDVVLVDDVLQTGRTVRAAIDAVLDYGRPRRIWLATLLDRGGRELPIAPDFCGALIEAAPDEKVIVEPKGEARGAFAVPRSGAGNKEST